MDSRHRGDGNPPIRRSWGLLALGIALVAVGVALGVHTAPLAPDPGDVVYTGSYVPLTGVHMTPAYASTIALDFDFDRTHDHLVLAIVAGVVGLLLAGLGAYRLRTAGGLAD